VKRSTPAAALAGIAITLSSSLAFADDAHDRPQPPPVERSDDDTDAFRIGAVAGVGFPHPLAIEALVKVERVLAVGLEYSVLPTTNIGGVETKFWALAGDARVFPFKNGFFIGLRGGRQVLSARATASLGALGTYSESGAAETWFVNPRIGFLWTWRSGFTIGFDAGVQVPIGPTLTTTLPAGLLPQVDSTVATIANTFGNEVTPTVDLLRIGFLF
jgi:hypothetical protein